MALKELNHYLVLAKDIEASKLFYTEALGMEIAPRPQAPFPGYWLSVKGVICVHLAAANDDPKMLEFFAREAGKAGEGSGAVHHIAFMADDLSAFLKRFDALKVSILRRYVADARLEQIFVNDPDGVTIEINFPGYPLNQ